jgi:hypothetical protein
VGVDELWSGDYEVLHWVVERFERDGQLIRLDDVLAAFPAERHDEVKQSLRRWTTHGYLDSVDRGRGLGSASSAAPLVITAVHERSLRAVGAWPDNAEVLADRILAVLAEGAESEPDPRH